MDETAKRELLDTAWESVRYGLKAHRPLPVKTAKSEQLNQPGASFVTLEKHHQLRGCMGSLEAHCSLIEDVASNAYNAAFRDPRFAALNPEELSELDLQISILSRPVAIEFSDEANLLDQLRPGEDGIVFEAGAYRSTFLPQVWEQLPTAQQFLSHLKQKAGLSANYWGPDVRIKRYRVEKLH